MVEVIPSLPANTFQELSMKVGKVHAAIDTFQIDVADGLFVTNRSWPMNPGDKEQFQRIVKGQEQLPFADKVSYVVHFMAHNPEKLLPDWVRAGIVRALFHPEAKHDFSALTEVANKAGIELGVSLKVGTPIDRIEPYIKHISVVQLMGIKNIGVQGQPFAEEVLDAIREVKEHYPSVTIAVDGSVNAETAPRLVAAGATRLAPGSYVLGADDPEAAIHKLKNA